VGAPVGPFLARYRAYAIAISATIFTVTALFVVICEVTRR
jgi:hypothetical protein